MTSIRSIRAGLSRSYHSLNTMGGEEEERIGGEEGGGGGRDNNNTTTNTSSNTSYAATTDWIDVDNFRTKNNNKSSPLSAIKVALAKVSRGRASGSSHKISTILKDLDDEWRVSEDGDDGEVFLG